MSQLHPPADSTLPPHPVGGPRPSARGARRILILGGGFGGVYTALNLQKKFKRDPSIEITLVSRDNYFLITPLLFEAGSGVLEPRHAVSPIRMMLPHVRFIDAQVESVNFDSRRVFARHVSDNVHYELEYDHLVLALGGVTNRALVPGSQHALGFKTLADAIVLRNRIIDLFEQADVERDPQRRQQLLTIVIIGGGLVGVELMGELTEFAFNLLRSYPRIPKDILRFFLIEAHPRIIPEMDESLAAYAANVFKDRGVSLMTGIRVKAIEPGKVILPDGSAPASISAETILLTAGLTANPLLEHFPIAKAKNGRLVVSAAMQTAEFPHVWALGDCAAIPDPQGNPYPPLAQHALREARVLARNIAAALHDKPLRKFEYETKGMLASLGSYTGVGRIKKIKIRGFLAWWVWRTYYLMQMPRWERRVRLVLDWTVALFFHNDIVKLDLIPENSSPNAPPPGKTFQKVD